MSSIAKDSGGVLSQTLSRGLQILEILATRGGAMSSADISAALGLHRSITYRLLRTLEHHRLLVRDDRGHFLLGPKLASLSATVERDLQQAAFGPLRTAANDLGMTVFLTTLDGDEAITLMSLQPQRSVVAVAQHPGTQHPLGIGAPGRAVLHQLPRGQWPSDLNQEQIANTEAVAEVGYAQSRSEVIGGLQSVAVPIELRGYVPLAVCTAFLHQSLSNSAIAARLEQAVQEIR